jgi:hypothetical protein
MDKYQLDRQKYADRLEAENARIADLEAAADNENMPSYDKKFLLEDYVSVYDEVIVNLQTQIDDA